MALVALGALTLLSPASLGAWGLVDGALIPVALNNPGTPAAEPARVDLGGDGTFETLDLTSAVLTIRSDGRTLWQSPVTWSVLQAEFTDLNRDGRPEVSLLVWRAFEPLPTDRVLPHAGRIDGFHDALGRSCHLILIGAGGRGGFRELWAGSALADPITSFAAADLDRDGRQELVTLENRYTDDPVESPGRSMKVWEWNGFGFTVVDAAERRISKFVVTESNGSSQILAQVVP